MMKRMGDEMGEDLGDDVDAAMDEAMAEGDGDGQATECTAVARAAWPTRPVPMKVEVLPALTGSTKRPGTACSSLGGAVRLPHLEVADGVGARVRPDRPLQILAVTDDDGRLVGLLPLYEDGPDRLRVVGGVDVSDYLDLIAAAGSEEEVWQALLQHRAAQRRVGPPRGPRGLAHRRVLPRLAPSWGLRVVAEVEERCPVLALPATWDDYLAKLSGKDRHELQRKMRKLERELPDVTVSVHARAEGSTRRSAGSSPCTGSPRSARRSSWTSAWSDSSATSPSRSPPGLGAPVVSRVRGRPRGELSLHRDGGSVGLYNSGFDPAHARLAPGIVLLAHVIRDAIERGVPVFDFLRGEEPYKCDFGPTAEPLLNIGSLP